ncbi:MAG: SusC/RagA family TonB-linked outer membrane protein, partial [Chitinophagaceae bacterium]|nr:SusC/RagA family TonB-linked outer membrane protein [Chitinophagaceae bacterium]
MRLLSFFLFVTLLSVHGEGTAQNVSISGRSLTIEKIFTAIKKQTGFVVFGNRELLSNRKTIRLEVTNMPLKDVLAIIFKDQPVEYSLSDKTIFISPKQPSITSPGKIHLSLSPVSVIRIRVVDRNGNPLPGASVIVKASKISTLTDAQGMVDLSANEGDILQVSYVGMETSSTRVTRSLLDAGSLTITLNTTDTRLDAVEVTVNTGYQTISRERSAGAFSKPDMQTIRNRSTSMNILQRLDGLVPGLTVNSSPAAASNPLLIRGLTSIKGATAPLYVVDGIQMNDISSVNPNDVEDITVLKDATAASIWGSRASNGVIVITTKKGGKANKLTIDYDGFMSFQGKPDIEYFPVLNSRQFIQAAKETFNPVANLWSTIVALGPVHPHDQILYDQYRGLIDAPTANAKLDSLASLNNVQQIKDLWYRNGMLSNQTISIRGGGQVHSFYGSLAYTNTMSSTPGASNRSFKANLRQDLSINKNLQFFLITDLTNTLTSFKRAIAPDNRFLPYVMFKDNAGNNLSMNHLVRTDSLRKVYETRGGINLAYNPMDEYNYGETRSDGFLARITGGASINLFKGLRFEGVYGLIKGNNKTTLYDEASSYFVRAEAAMFAIPSTTGGPVTYYLPKDGAKYAVTNSNQRDWTIRNQLVYDNAWNDRKHQITLLAGQEAQNQRTNNISTTVRGYDPQLLTYSNINWEAVAKAGGTGTNTFYSSSSFILNDSYKESETETRFTSYYGNAAYTYDGKYSLNASIRSDESNLFGKDKSAQSRPVWSAGGAWLLSQERFMEDTRWINQLTLRATYGVTGNSPIPPGAASYDILSPGTILGPVTLYVSTPANKNLSWESTRSINLGLDFSLLNRRLQGSLDVYHKHTSDLIGNQPVNPFTGYTQITGNLGDIVNKGIEARIQSVNISTKDFRWSSMLVFAYNENKITELAPATAITTGGQLINNSFVKGYSAFAIFAYPFAGLDALGDPQIRLSDKTVTKAAGVAKPNDMVYAGTYQPKYNGGFSNIFQYRDFGLSVNMIYNLG